MYLTPSAPLRSVQGNMQAWQQSRLRMARFNAIQARRTLTALGYMGISAPAVVPRARRRKRLTAMGCEQCRTGLSWLSQDDDDDTSAPLVVPVGSTSGIDVSNAPIATDLIAPAASTPVLTNTASPGSLLSDIGVASGLFQTALTRPTGPVLTNTPGQPLPQAQLQPGGLISGVPNTYLYIAGGAIVLLGLLAGRR